MSGATIEHRYRLVREIASGTMGAVWEAIDTVGSQGPAVIAPGTHVALKALHPELHSDASIRRRFRREASVLQAVSHPAVVRVLDVGSESGERSYTVMELLDGETLEARLAREGKIAAAAFAPMLRAICAGLTAGHAHGVVHGDLKPANLFVQRDPIAPVKIVDFGLSKIEGLERLTRTGELNGTPLYMAPELLTGARGLDARLDQYALGIVLFQALAGRPPFVTGRHPGALTFDIVAGRGAALDDVAPEVPTAVRRVVARAMASDRDQRFADVAALALAYDEALR